MPGLPAAATMVEEEADDAPPSTIAVLVVSLSIPTGIATATIANASGIGDGRGDGVGDGVGGGSDICAHTRDCI